MQDYVKLELENICNSVEHTRPDEYVAVHVVCGAELNQVIRSLN